MIEWYYNPTLKIQTEFKKTLVNAKSFINESLSRYQ